MLVWVRAHMLIRVPQKILPKLTIGLTATGTSAHMVGLCVSSFMHQQYVHTHIHTFLL